MLPARGIAEPMTRLLPICLALMLGANIGTCGTACVAAVGKKKETVQVALAYLLFKLIGVALAVAG